jgi:hypothetical protein
MTTGFGLKASPGKGSQFHFTLSKDMAMKNEPVSLAKIWNGFEMNGMWMGL